MRRWLPLPVALVCFAAMAAPGARQEDKIVPVHQEPRHHLVFETAGTKILDVQIPPGDTTLFHTHSTPILYVTMSTARTRSQTHGREWGGDGDAAAVKAMTVAEAPVVPGKPAGRNYSVTTYAKEPLTHRVNNVGVSLFRLIGITNESAGDPSAAPGADFPGKPETDNPWFRSYRWTLTAPVDHRHANPVVVVAVTGRATVDHGTTTRLEEPRPYLWIAANTPHKISGATADAEVIEVELRQPR
jgi:quercetin dioxygenase-like cupin family protein